MKILIAATALSLVAATAIAGEGGGNPFPFAAPPVTTDNANYKQAASALQNPFPYRTPGVAVTMSVLPTNGSEGAVQTANSMPPHFEDGAVAIANLNRQAAPATVIAQPSTKAPGSRG